MEGVFRNGRPHGSCSVKLPDGSTYIGNLAYGLRHGTGILTYAEDDKQQRKRYTGSWQQDQKHGFGVLEWKV